MKCQIHLSHCEQWTVVELIQGKAGGIRCMAERVVGMTPAEADD